MKNPFSSIQENIQVLRDQYQENEGINNSSLSIFEKSPKLYKKAFIDRELNLSSDENHFKFGSLVDCLITTPDLFNDKFVIEPPYSPTGLLLDFINNIVSNRNTFELNLDDLLTHPENLSEENNERVNKYIERQYIITGFKRDKLEKVIKNIEEPDNISYIRFRINSLGKTVITAEDYALAIRLKDSTSILETNPNTAKWVKSELADIVINQCPLYMNDPFGNYKKGLLDQLLVFNKDKVIVIKDYKTTAGYIAKFGESFEKYRYGRQLAYYYTLVGDLIRDTEYKDYTIKIFIVAIEKQEPFEVMAFKMDKSILAIELTNLLDLLHNFKDCVSSNDFNFPEYKISGHLTLSVDNVSGYK